MPDGDVSPLLHPLGLVPLRRSMAPGRRYLALALLPAIAAVAAAYAIHPFGITTGGHAVAPAAATAGQSPKAVAAAGGAFDVCYANPSWSPPEADIQAAHLQADPRYRGINLAAVKPERIHVELGPFRSNSALGDFVALSGLWDDPGWRSMTCSGDLHGKVELWALGLQLERFQPSGADLTAVLTPRTTGIEIVQAMLPKGAIALHLVDPSGTKLAPDVNLQAE